MDRVQPGDVIFSYSKAAIGAVAVATSGSYLARRPPEYRFTDSDEIGRRVDAVYRILGESIAKAQLGGEILTALMIPGGPIANDFHGNRGYLYGVPNDVARRIVSVIESVNGPHLLDQAIIQSASTETERETIGLARVGQGLFREQLIAMWRGRCAVSGLENQALLRASHIKAWRDSNNAERLDVHNGLLLGVNYDAPFDRGLISFQDDGRIIISPRLAQEDAQKIGITERDALRHVAELHRSYLLVHRETNGF